jgi:hypothetical protein
MGVGFGVAFGGISAGGIWAFSFGTGQGRLMKSPPVASNVTLVVPGTPVTPTVNVTRFWAAMWEEIETATRTKSNERNLFIVTTYER